MSAVPLRDQIADFIANAGDPNPKVEAHMRTLLFDYLSVTTGGASLNSSQAALASITTAAAQSPSHPSRLWGTALWASPEDAALVNGITGHGLELDDTYEPSSLHPGVVVFSAVLALAQSTNATWAETVRAAVIGYDVMAQVGVYVGAKEIYGRGFHPTGVAGAWGSTAACAALLGLGTQKTREALSLGANMAAGSLEFLGDGSWTKRLNAGFAASVGFRAVGLARAGFTGPSAALEGLHGFATQYGMGTPETRELQLDFGRSALDTSIKFFPCCRYMHGGMDLLAAHRSGNPSLDVEAIRSIDVAVITAGRALVADPPEKKTHITTSVDAQFSMPFGAAAALLLDHASVETFDNAVSYAPQFQAVMDKVNCISSPEIDAPYPERWAAAVTIRLHDGSQIHLDEPAFVGSPGNPADSQRLNAKAAGLIGEENAGALKHAVDSLEKTQPIGSWGTDFNAVRSKL
jgi:2-methylcitrate dehydratase PrpD